MTKRKKMLDRKELRVKAVAGSFLAASTVASGGS
jgi:hypothetical protein